MCGIAGYIGENPPDQSSIKITSDILSHRGPDGEGFYTHSIKNNRIVMVHRRLAILDLDSRSNQPFVFRGTVLIFNGEIYNYIEIRDELKKLGHTFKTSGDTEVLIHALCEWGNKALSKLEGMWAFAWYKEQDGSLLLSRDRFGEKPLYIWPYNNGIYFASEVKGLAALAQERPQINQERLLRNLINGYKSIFKTKHTYFKNINSLSPGTFLKIDTNLKSITEKYWEPKFEEEKNLSYADIVDMTKVSLINAVKLRMRSDVPLAFCMSGGVDSNSLISIASKILNCEVHGFTIVNTDKRYEEQDLINKAVSQLGIKHTEVKLSKENFISNLEKLVISHDAPVSTISYYAHWQLMEQVRKHNYKISISGTGADELFSGYYDHHLFYLASILKNKDIFNESKKNWIKYVSPFVRNKSLKDPERFINDPDFRDHIYSGIDVSGILKKNFYEPFDEKNFEVSLLRKRMLNELFYESVPVILFEDDANAMHYSIENRSPFLDSQLFETSLKIPTKFLIKGGRAKSVLRDSMSDIVPKQILDSHRKVGFNAPIEDLLDFKNDEIRDSILDKSQIYEIVNRENIEKILNQENISNETSKFLFSFLGTKIFLEKFN